MEMPEFYSLYNDSNNPIKHSILMEIIQKWRQGLTIHLNMEEINSIHTKMEKTTAKSIRNGNPLSLACHSSIEN